jgi:hypothetical protein
MAVPHSPQNRVVGPLAVPQAGHTAASLVPHSPQNLRPASLAVPQDGQVKQHPSATVPEA